MNELDKKVYDYACSKLERDSHYSFTISDCESLSISFEDLRNSLERIYKAGMLMVVPYDNEIEIEQYPPNSCNPIQ